MGENGTILECHSVNISPLFSRSFCLLFASWSGEHVVLLVSSPPLSPLPIDLPRDWARRVNQPESQKEPEALRESAARRRP